jgi:hypothetical protein
MKNQVKIEEKTPHEEHPKEFASFVKEFVNDHGSEWRPLRGLWPEDVFDFMWKLAHKQTIKEAREDERKIRTKHKEEHQFPQPHFDEGCEKCGGFPDEPCEPPVNPKEKKIISPKSS